MADMFTFKGLELNSSLLTKTNRAAQEAQRFIDSECLRHCAPLLPRDNDAILTQSGIIHSQGEIRWETPYARRWYYMPANFQEGEGSGMKTVGRGNYWFERMKQQHKNQILKGAQKVLKENL